jgi:hypothetical protein
MEKAVREAQSPCLPPRTKAPWHVTAPTGASIHLDTHSCLFTLDNMALRAAEWHKLPTSLTELCINTTLRCGQSFRYDLAAAFTCHSNVSSDGASPPKTSGPAHSTVASSPCVKMPKHFTTAQSTLRQPPNFPRHLPRMRRPSLPTKMIPQPS